MSDADDEVDRGVPLDRALLARLAGWLRPHAGILLGGVGLLVLGRACDWIGPWILERTVDGPLRESLLAEGAAPPGALRTLAWLAAAYLATAALHGVAHWSQTRTLTRLGQAATFDVRRQLFDHLLRLPLRFFDRKPVGELVTRMTSDVENLVELFSTGAAALLLDPLWVVAVLITLFAIDARLAAVAVVTLPLFAWVSFRFRERARRAYRDTRRAIGRSTAFVQESIAGVRVTQLCVQQERQARRFADVAGALRDAWLVTVHHFALFFAGVDWLSGVARALVFGAGMLFVLRGTLTPGEWFRFSVCLGYLFEPLRELAERWNVLQSALVSTERIVRILDEPAEPQGAVAHAPAGALEFRDVRFAYGPGAPAVDGVSFRVEPGQTVALVGATGAGKSTLFQLLLALYRPGGGAIALDGVDATALTLAALRGGIGVVPQDVFLFADTILENVRLFDPAIDETRVRAALDAVGAGELLARLPEGVATRLGERGANLSAGERQLLAFARVLVRDPRILLLDEATSSVDTGSERRLQRAVETLLRGRTCLVIAHRLSTVRRADRILVLHKGQLREAGTHAELLARGGLYARLHALHFSTELAAPPAPAAAAADAALATGEGVAGEAVDGDPNGI